MKNTKISHEEKIRIIKGSMMKNALHKQKMMKLWNGIWPIDIAMIPIVKLLNSHPGLRTNNCCQGGEKDLILEMPSGYVSVSGRLKKKFVHLLLDDQLNVPVAWMEMISVQVHPGNINSDSVVIRFHSGCINSLFKRFKRVMKNL